MDSLLQRVESYLGSSFLLLAPGPVRRWMIARRYPEIVDNLSEGLEATADLLAFAFSLAEKIARLEVEVGEADETVGAIHRCAIEPVLLQLASNSDSGFRHQRRLERFDSAVRGNPNLVALLRELIESLHRFDALQSLAAASVHLGFTFPEVKSSEVPFIDLRGVFHPLIKRPVQNDVSFARDTRLLFLTGPNMAGKTTFMKACGLVVLLAHVGMAVPASFASLSVFDRLFAALSVHDSIADGESFFLAEVRRVRSLVDFAINRQSVFALVDEMFKGTNVIDAREATTAVVHGLSKAERVMTIVSSHIIEVAETLGGCPGIAFSCFHANLEGTSVAFSYRLLPGVSAERVGWLLLEREGVVDSLAILTDPRRAPQAK